MNATAAAARAGLARGEVHVWAVQLEASDAHFLQCRDWLSPDENSRAARFHFDEHRRVFILGRGVLRSLLGSMLGIAPGEIQFSYGSKGKPALADPGHLLRFNASNCWNVAVYAFLEGCEIGVDVEQLRPIPDMQQIAERFFAPSEAAELMSVVEQDRTQAFFNCWTRKEAYMKAVGDGFSIALDSFRVTLRPGAQAEMLCLGGSVEAAKAWTIDDLSLGPGMVGALAYAGKRRPLYVRPLTTVDELQSAGV